MTRKPAVLLSALIGVGFFFSMVGAALAAPGVHSTHFTARNASASGYCASAEELAFLKLINDYRKSKGIGALALSQTLSAASEHHSSSMATYNYFDHFLVPEGISWSTNMANYGYNFSTWKGENIAGGNSSAAATFDQWKNSPGHNANMLNANYTAIGIGLVYGAKSTYGYYWTTDFGGYKDGTAQICGTSDSGGIGGSDGPLKVYRTGYTSNSRSGLYCLDGQQDTSWYTTSTDVPRYAYVWFDFGSVKAFSSVKWKFNRTGYADYFEIQVSNDRQSWTTIGHGTNVASNTWQTLTRKTSARYTRFLFRNPNNDAKLGFLSEVRVYP
ncbi:MAG: CAP domain-containing protein [Thermomicrobiales bacterium]